MLRSSLVLVAIAPSPRSASPQKKHQMIRTRSLRSLDPPPNKRSPLPVGWFAVAESSRPPKECHGCEGLASGALPTCRLAFEAQESPDTANSLGVSCFGPNIRKKIPRPRNPQSAVKLGAGVNFFHSGKNLSSQPGWKFFQHPRIQKNPTS